MKTRFLLGLLCLMIFSSGYSQKKKDLLAEIDRLNSELSSKDEALVEARKSENASVAKAESFEAQLTELQQANATLLNNLKVLTEATKERSNNIGRTLESLQEKESQIKMINDAFSSYDSIALLVLTSFKQTLGEDARISVETGAIAVALDKAMLFGQGDGREMQEGGQEFMSKIGAVMNANPDLEATILVSSDSLQNPDLIRQRLGAVWASLENGAKVAPERLFVTKRTAFGEAYQLRIHPALNTFYLRTRENIKGRR